MGKWIEIPARRVLGVDADELFKDYDQLGEDGFPVKMGERCYRVVKRSNGKVFKPAEFLPATSPGEICFFLEEL